MVAGGGGDRVAFSIPSIPDESFLCERVNNSKEPSQAAVKNGNNNAVT